MEASRPEPKSPPAPVLGFPPPTLSECRHRSFARCCIAVRWRAACMSDPTGAALALKAAAPMQQARRAG